MNNSSSRIFNSLKNFKFGLIFQLVQYALSFITRTIFIKYLSAEYLGISSVVSNILVILSLAESGMGGSFQVLLYKALYENDNKKLSSIMTSFKRSFKIIGSVVFIIGLLIIPILRIYIDESIFNTFIIVYIMFLLSSLVNYIATPFNTIIKADQKNYIIIKYDQFNLILKYILQIIILVFTQNFILYIGIEIFSTVIFTIVKIYKAKKMYPCINIKGEPLSNEIKKDLNKKISAGFFHHGGYVVYNGTDNLVITYYLGLSITGLYSNYILIINIIKRFYMMVFNSYSASVGNQVYSDSIDENFRMFRNILFFNSFFMGFVCICLYFLFNPFISLWIGKEYTFSNWIVLLIVILLFIDSQGSRRTIWLYKNATGLFYKDRYVSLIEGILNIVISVFLVTKIGLAGVFLGTILSYLLTAFWVEPLIVFKYYFKKSILIYFLLYFKHILIILITSIIIYYANSLIQSNNIIYFIIRVALTVILSLVLFVLFNINTDEFKYFRKLCKRIIRER